MDAGYAKIANDAIHVVIPIFCVATMFAIGLDVTMSEAMAPLRQMLALGTVVLVNNVLIPLLGFVIIAMPAVLAINWFASLSAEIVPLTGGAQLGFLLLILASGSMLAPPLAQIAGANVPTAKGVMLVLVVASVLLVPVELPLLCGFTALTACKQLASPPDSGSIAMALIVLQLVPLAVGLFIKARYDAIAVRLRPLVSQLAGLSLLVLLAMLILSGSNVFQLPAEAPLARNNLFADKDLVVSVPISDTTILFNELRTGSKSSSLNPPQNAVAVKVAPASPSTWAVVNAETTYSLSKTSVAQQQPTLAISGTRAIPAATLTDTEAISTIVSALDKRQISPVLGEKLGAAVSADSVIVVNKGGQWLLANSTETYFVEVKPEQEQRDDGKAAVALYQETSQPVGLVASGLKFLEGVPVIGQFVALLAKLITLVLPYLLFAALAGVIMLIGKYTGVAVRNIVGATGEGIPRSMAISTAIRNVSIALLVADGYFRLPVGPTAAPDYGAIAVILVFYVVSLIVAGHQAVQWGKEPVAEPATEQGQPATASSSAGITSAPAT